MTSEQMTEWARQATPAERAEALRFWWALRKLQGIQFSPEDDNLTAEQCAAEWKLADGPCWVDEFVEATGQWLAARRAA